MTSRRGRRSFLWLLSLVALATGCASSVEIPPQAVSQLLELRNGLIDGRAQIQKTTGAAKDLVERPRVDVQPQVNAFRAQMSQLSKDALQATTTFSWPPQIDLPGYRPVTRPHSKQIREASRLIAAAKRPVLYVGGGIVRAKASDRLHAAESGEPHSNGDRRDGTEAAKPRQVGAGPRLTRRGAGRGSGLGTRDRAHCCLTFVVI